MDRLSTPLLSLFSSLTTQAEIVEQSPWRAPFEAKGVTGTFVLWEPLRQRYRVSDTRRSRKGYLPHATFDAAGALIGLEVGAVNDELEVFR